VEALIAALIGGATVAAQGIASDAVNTAYSKLKGYLEKNSGMLTSLQWSRNLSRRRIEVHWLRHWTGLMWKPTKN